ncbi:MAG TPA: LPS export ABC transporter permease LptF [Burkholderiaceae bacterium]
MLFDSTVRKELARSFGATLMVILTIFMTNLVIRTLGLAANGAVAAQDVVVIFTLLALQTLPTILALSLFVGVIITLGRMYRESEMAIWFSSGIGLARFIRPVLATSWPVIVLIAGLMLFVWPWSYGQYNELRQRFEQRADVLRAAPGQFQTSADGHRVFFVEKAGAAQAGGGRNVFILNDLGSKESVAVSQSGRLENDDGQRVLVLDSGHMQQTDKATGEHTHVEFEHYRVKAGDAAPPSNAPSPRAVDTAELLMTGGPAYMGELTWRIGLILGATNLLFMAISLAATNPRRPSNWSLLFALLAFVVYYNLLNLSQAWVSGGRVGATVAIVGLHGAALLVGLGLIWWREHATVIHPLRLLLRKVAR